ncbi:MAG TPA: formyltetrahydrofolate deformylase [Symbiobacteriaceae bacterium]|nr:formyltetrahydrofolate deformylase [Symbiobacteriaceae bacterium]
MKLTTLTNRGRMLISCPDQPGIIAAVSNFLCAQGANIIHSDQHSTDHRQGTFFMRVEFDLPELLGRGPALEKAFAPVAERFQMDWRLSYAEVAKRMAIFVSREDHCLLELLWQWRAGDLRGDIAMVVSNHADLKASVEPLGIPFHHLPMDKENKAETEAAQLELLSGRVDLVVLARYMQILSPGFIADYRHRIINIHHSFLPAFVGAKPYAQAYERGVKLIGATAHYVTEDLDAGPIIEQDVQRVDHRSDAQELRRMGRHVERTVLARAVAWHLEDRVLVHGNKTVVFA